MVVTWLGAIVSIFGLIAHNQILVFLGAIMFCFMIGQPIIAILLLLVMVMYLRR